MGVAKVPGAIVNTRILVPGSFGASIDEIDDRAIVAAAVHGETDFTGAARRVSRRALRRQFGSKVPQRAGIEFGQRETLVAGPAATGDVIGDDHRFRAPFGDPLELFRASHLDHATGRVDRDGFGSLEEPELLREHVVNELDDIE
jgi:hypothetical protein